MQMKTIWSDWNEYKTKIISKKIEWASELSMFWERSARKTSEHTWNTIHEKYKKKKVWNYYLWSKFVQKSFTTADILKLMDIVSWSCINLKIINFKLQIYFFWRKLQIQISCYFVYLKSVWTFTWGFLVNVWEVSEVLNLNKLLLKITWSGT